MNRPALSRRQALLASFGLAASVQLIGSRALAADTALVRKRLVVVICRGGLDGLSLSPPVGDPAYAALRGPIAIPPFGAPDGALKLDETFGLHPALTATYALAQKGQARIVPAVATPDRERSHFEAQDVLESGAPKVYGESSGWLARAVAACGPGKVRAIAVGPTAPLVLRGPIEAASWSPGPLAGGDARLPHILQDLYAGDAQLGAALATGLSTQTLAKTATNEAAQAVPTGAAGPEQARRLGATVAGFLTEPGGEQVAAISLDNFDTHANEGAAKGQLAGRLAYVDGMLDGLASGMGPAWKDTVVVLATEFGRTARVNGTGGTDHGTASTALVLGGAIRPGGIVGDWPTLAEARLFENRDLAPTLDMRGLFKGVLAGHLGVSRTALDTRVFPDSGGIAPARGLIA